MTTVIRTPEDAVSYYRCGLRYGGMVVERNGVRIAVPLPSVEEIRRELAGKTLACWCREDVACHGADLLAIANNPGLPSWLGSGSTLPLAAFTLTLALGIA